jgi:hypothetical protein
MKIKEYEQKPVKDKQKTNKSGRYKSNNINNYTKYK